MARNDSLLLKELRQKRPFPSTADEAAVAILRTADRVKRRLSAVVAPEGITLQQYNVLRILAGSHPDPLPTLEIAERMIEQTPAITGLLDRLEHKGLARRERCPSDRRLVHCWITEQGQAVLAMLNPGMAKAAEAIMSGLSKADQKQLSKSLDDVRSSMQ
jgi:DNA-binding MarR family transcriptional regulator